MERYIYDQSWERERDRLQGIEAANDAGSIDILERTGVGDGWRCLEVGGGAGSIAAWLARRVAPSGEVVATDIDTQFLESLDAPNLTVLKHDITTNDPLPGPFDLVHSRALLAHLPERQAVVERMAALLRPGGWIVIEDVDFASLGALDPNPVFERVLAAMATYMEGAGIDRHTGRKLRRMLVASGVTGVVSEGRVHSIDGSNPMAWLTFETLGPRLVATGLVTQADVDAALTMSRDPSFEVVTPIMFLAWGRRSV